MTKWLRTITHFLIPFLIILWVVYVNRFPEGFVYNSGDFSQPINLEMHFDELFYTWGNGISAPGEGGPFPWISASPFYYFFYILPVRFGLSNTQNLSFLLFNFLLLSYLSFYISLKVIFKKPDSINNVIFPLLYSINMTTLYFFTYTWGFSHHVFLYITFPVIFASFYLLLDKFGFKYLFVFLIMMFVSIPGFTNPAFFVALVFFLFAFSVCLIFLRGIPITKYLIYKMLIIGISTLCVLSFWILPIIPTISSNITGISSGIFNLKEWLIAQSSDILSILIGLPGYKSFPPFSHDIFIFYLPAFTTIFVLFFLISRVTISLENLQILKLVFSLLLIEIILVILLKKAKEPFGNQTLLLYSIPFLSIFRSYEKLAIFIPFINLTSIYGLILGKNVNSKIIILFMTIMLLAPFPFILGGIQTKYSITIGPNKSKDYLSADYSGLVKIPDDYYEAAALLNKTESPETKIQSLPFSPLNSTAWVNFPKWKLIGFDIADYLFDKPFIATNTSQYQLKGWIPQADLNITNLNPVWYVRLLSYFSVSHIFYHFDVDNRFIIQSFPKISQLEKDDLIERSYSGNNFTIYELKNHKNVRNIYIPQKLIVAKSEIKHFPRLLLQDSYTDESLYIFDDISIDSKYYDSVDKTEFITIYETLDDHTSRPFCRSYCFEINITSSGEYELHLSFDDLTGINLKEATVSLYGVDKDNTYGSIKLPFNNLSEYGFNQNMFLLNLTLDKEKSYYLVIDYNPSNNLISSEKWLSIDYQGELTNIIYKDIKNCVSGNTYSIEGLSASNISKYTISEDIPDFGVLKDSEIQMYFDDNSHIQNVKQIIYEGNSVASFSPLISMNSICTIYIDSSSKEDFNNISIYKSLNPILILKASTIKNKTNVKPNIAIRKINPTKYKVSVTRTNAPFILVLNESYNEQWGVFKNTRGSKVEISSGSHFISNGFSNGWVIDQNEIEGANDYELIIEYKTQKLYIVGMIISAITIMFISGVLITKHLLKKTSE